MKIDYLTDYPVPWKIDSPVERLLGKLADSNECIKALYVNYYKMHDKNFHQVAMKKINHLITEETFSCGGGYR